MFVLLLFIILLPREKLGRRRLTESLNNGLGSDFKEDLHTENFWQNSKVFRMFDILLQRFVYI